MITIICEEIKTVKTISNIQEKAQAGNAKQNIRPALMQKDTHIHTVTHTHSIIHLFLKLHVIHPRSKCRHKNTAVARSVEVIYYLGFNRFMCLSIYRGTFYTCVLPTFAVPINDGTYCDMVMTSTYFLSKRICVITMCKHGMFRKHECTR